MEMICERNDSMKQKTDETTDTKVEHDIAQGSSENVIEEKDKDDDEKLVVMLEQRLQSLLLSLTKLFRNKSSGHNKKE